VVPSRVTRLVLAIAAAGVAGWLASCGVELDDKPGRACDDSHACTSPRSCVSGHCFAPSELDGGVGGGGGGSDGGTGGGTGGGSATGGGGGSGGGSAGGVGGGTGTGGGGSVFDAGLSIWAQARDGFTSQTVGTNCSLEIDTLRENKVVSTIDRALDANDHATANELDGGVLPSTGDGHLIGKFQLPSTLTLNNNSVWLYLGSGNKAMVQLAFDSQGRLICSSSTGMLSTTAVTQTVSMGGGFMPNTDYLVDIKWKKGNYRTVSINGAQVANTTGLTDPGTVPALDQLKLGIKNLDGDAGTGWTISLTEWELADEDTKALP
jgi:hypothetical protein